MTSPQGQDQAIVLEAFRIHERWADDELTASEACDALAELLNRRTPPPAVSEVREAVAMIIDPDAFSAAYITETSTVADHLRMNARAAKAEAKADRIIALQRGAAPADAYRIIPHSDGEEG